MSIAYLIEISFPRKPGCARGMIRDGWGIMNAHLLLYFMVNGLINLGAAAARARGFGGRSVNDAVCFLMRGRLGVEETQREGRQLELDGRRARATFGGGRGRLVHRCNSTVTL